MDFTPTDFAFENEYPKLVRDRIPEKIQSNGKTAKIRTIGSDEEYLKALLAKLIEEGRELQRSAGDDNMREELADIFEIINSVLKLKNWTIEQIIEVQKEKLEKNGGFDKRIILLEKP
jgi:predicted house-cleaning noncanonical NTP pyrophosphatase (MazG superfamily)